MKDVIKWIRMINGIDSASQAAKLLGISQGYMSMLESGARIVTPELLDKIAYAYKIESSMIIYMAEAYEHGLCNRLEVMKIIIDYYGAKNNPKYLDDERNSKAIKKNTC